VLAHGGECCGVHANGVRSLDGLLIDVDAGYMHSACIAVTVSTVRKDMEGRHGGLAGLSARCWVLREHASVAFRRR
jgi:hypothetical protein